MRKTLEVVAMVLIAMLQLVVLASLAGCGDSGKYVEQVKVSNGKIVNMVEVEGCEYIRFTVTGKNNGGYSYIGNWCHKGNCKNSVHVYKAKE